MRRLDNSSQNLLHINSNIHNVMALALICVGNDISLDCLAFQANSLGQSTGSAPPTPPPPSPRRLMKKTSAGVEKVARPVLRDLAVSLFSLWQVLMRQGWLVSRPGGEDGQDGPFLRHHFTRSLRRQPSFPPSSPLSTCSSPSPLVPCTLATQLH